MNQSLEDFYLGTKFPLKGIDGPRVGQIEAESLGAPLAQFLRAGLVLMVGEKNAGPRFKRPQDKSASEGAGSSRDENIFSGEKGWRNYSRGAGFNSNPARSSIFKSS